MPRQVAAPTSRAHPLGAQRVVAVDDLGARAGERIGVSRWQTVSQQQISSFADATGDHQWIHVDPVRAAAGPFGTTIAHGYHEEIAARAYERYQVRLREASALDFDDLLNEAVRLFDEAFFDGEAKEAVAFAFLGYLHLRGRPGNVPSATGARGPRVLGAYTPA